MLACQPVDAPFFGTDLDECWYYYYILLQHHHHHAMLYALDYVAQRIFSLLWTTPFSLLPRVALFLSRSLLNREMAFASFPKIGSTPKTMLKSRFQRRIFYESFIEIAFHLIPLWHSSFVVLHLGIHLSCCVFKSALIVICWKYCTQFDAQTLLFCLLCGNRHRCRGRWSCRCHHV